MIDDHFKAWSSYANGARWVPGSDDIVSIETVADGFAKALDSLGAQIGALLPFGTPLAPTPTAKDAAMSFRVSEAYGLTIVVVPNIDYSEHGALSRALIELPGWPTSPSLFERPGATLYERFDHVGVEGYLSRSMADRYAARARPWLQLVGHASIALALSAAQAVAGIAAALPPTSWLSHQQAPLPVLGVRRIKLEDER